MATIVSGTLVANVETVETVDAGDRGLLVTNTAQQGLIYVRVDGDAATVAGDDCFAVVGDRIIDIHGDDISVSLISGTTPTYSVEALD